MTTLGTKWIADLKAVPATSAPSANLTLRTIASVRELIRGGRDDELRALVAAHNAEQGQPEPIVVPSIFAQPGWFAVRYDALQSPAELVGAGVKWVAATLSHGANADGSHNNDGDDIANQQWLGNQRDHPYRAAGIKVGAWAWHEVQPEIEAAIAKTHITSYKLDFWIANAEEVWKPDAGARFVAHGPERYAAALAPALPASFPVGWSVLGAPPPPHQYGYDYDAFLTRGWHILPQAYPQQSPEYELGNVLDHALELQGIRPERVHPTIANYAPQKAGAFQPTIQEWQNELREAKARGVVGFSVWAHDFQVAQVKALTESVA